MGKPKPRERDALIELREIEALSLECECGSRVEVTYEGRLQDGATCPQCGKPVERRETAERFYAFLHSAVGATDVRIRVRLLKRLPL